MSGVVCVIDGLTESRHTKPVRPSQGRPAMPGSTSGEGALPEARVRVDRFYFGPPVGFPVQFRVIGPDPMKVRTIADQVRAVMAENPDVIDPHVNWGEQEKSIRLEVDQDRARALGLTPHDVSQMLATLLTGYNVTQYREGIEHIDVIARSSCRAPRPRSPPLADDYDAQRHRGAAVADCAAQLPIRGADPLAPQPRHRADRAQRCCRQRPGARCDKRDHAQA
jgi:hypothetical protein